jgi:hypothetical protein
MTVLAPAGESLGAADPLQVEFELPGGRFVRALCRVANEQVGVRFRRTGLRFLQVECLAPR